MDGITASVRCHGSPCLEPRVGRPLSANGDQIDEDTSNGGRHRGGIASSGDRRERRLFSPSRLGRSLPRPGMHLDNWA